MKRLAVALLFLLLLCSVLFNGILLLERQHDRHAAATVPVPPPKDAAGENPAVTASAPAATLELKSAWQEGSYRQDETYAPLAIHLKFRELSPASTVSLNDITILPRPRKITDVAVNNRNECVISGDFDLNTDYAVTIRSGLLARSDSATQQLPVVALAPAIQAPSQFDFTSNALYYPAVPSRIPQKRICLGIRHINIQRGTLYIYRQNPRNFDLDHYDLFQYRNMTQVRKLDILFSAKPADGEPSESIRLPLAANRRRTDTLDITELLQGQPAGLYCIRFCQDSPKEEDSWWDSDDTQCHLVLSDLAPAITFTDRSAAVAVHRLSDRRPVANAKVRLISRKRNILAEGITDEQGIACLNFPAPQKGEKHPDESRTLLVATEDDSTLLRFDQFSPHSTAAFENSGRLFSATPGAFLSTERGIYRPGENLYATLLLRTRQQAASAPAALPCFLWLKNAKNEILSRQKVVTDSNGVALSKFTIPKTVHDGAYSLQCGLTPDEPWGSIPFLVGDFTPDRIKFTVKNANDAPKTGELPEWQLAAQFYYGGEITDAEISLLTILSHPAIPLHWKEYTTVLSHPQKQFTRLQEQKRSFSSLHGRYSYPEPPAELQQMQGPVQMTLQAILNEPSSRAITATQSAVYLPADAYIGLRQLSPENDTARLEAILLPWTRGNAVTKTCRASLTLRKKEWVYQEIALGSSSKREWQLMETESRQLPDAALHGTPEILQIPSLKDGYYELTVTSLESNDTAVLPFWHWQGDAGSVHTGNPAILTAQADKERYLPGETATLTIQAPAEGRLLLACGEQDILQTTAHDVRPGTNTFAVAIPQTVETADYFTAATLITMQDGEYRRSFALLRLPLDQTAHKLPLQIQAAPQCEPDSPLPVTLHAPAGSTIFFWAVDEGILSLTQYKTPSPYDFFFGRRFCDFRSFDIYDLLYPELAIGGTAKTGGDGAASSFHSPVKLPRNAVYVLPSLLTVPASGTVTISITPRDFQGSLRLLALGASGNAVGVAEQQLTVREKIVCQASAPAALAPGDLCHLQFRVDASSLVPGEIRCQAVDSRLELPVSEKTDGSFVLQVRMPESISSPANGPVSARGEKGVVLLSYPICVNREGAFDISYTLKGNGFQKKGTIPLHVRSPYPAATKTQLHAVAPGTSISLSPVEHAIGKRKLTLSPGPQEIITRSLFWLAAYPYSCLEQRTSSAFPLLAIRQTAEGQKKTQSQLDAVAIHLLGQFQGFAGFQRWPGCRIPWPEASLYAAHFLLEYAPPYLQQETRRQLLAFLDNRQQNFPEDRAYVAYLMALAKDSRGRLLAMQVLENTVAPSLQTLLAGAALVQAGEASTGLPAIQAALDAHVWNAAAPSDGIPWIFQSGPARMGLCLAVATRYTTGNPNTARLMQDLLETASLSGKFWDCTLDNAWGAYGLLLCLQGQQAQRYDLEKDAISGTIAVNSGKPMAFQSEKSCSYAVASDAAVSITNTGKSPLYLLSQTVVNPPAEERGGNVKVLKEILRMDGTPAGSWEKGDLLQVRIRMTPKDNMPNAVLEDRLPGCFAIETGALATRQKAVPIPPPGKAPDSFRKPEYQDNQADRFLWFGSLPAGEESWVTYNVRVVAQCGEAVPAAHFAMPPAHVEDMYHPERQGTSLAK